MGTFRIFCAIGSFFVLSACNDATPTSDQVDVAPNIQADGGISGAGMICLLHMQRVALPTSLNRDTYLATFETVAQRWWEQGGTDAEMAIYATLTPSFDDPATEGMMGQAASPLLGNCLTLAAAAPEIMGMTQ